MHWPQADSVYNLRCPSVCVSVPLPCHLFFNGLLTSPLSISVIFCLFLSIFFSLCLFLSVSVRFCLFQSVFCRFWSVSFGFFLFLSASVCFCPFLSVWGFFLHHCYYLHMSRDLVSAAICCCCCCCLMYAGCLFTFQCNDLSWI